MFYKMNWTLDKDKSEEEKIYLGEFRRWFKVVFMTTNPMNFQFQLKLKYGQEKSDRKLLLAVTELRNSNERRQNLTRFSRFRIIRLMCLWHPTAFFNLFTFEFCWIIDIRLIVYDFYDMVVVINNNAANILKSNQ